MQRPLFFKMMAPGKSAGYIKIKKTKDDVPRSKSKGHHQCNNI